MTPAKEKRLRLEDLKIDAACWDGVTAAVESAREMGFDIENLLDRVRDEWSAQEDQED